MIKSTQKKKKKEMMFGEVPSPNQSEKNCEIDEQC